MAATEPITGAYQTFSGQPGAIVIENPPFHRNILNLTGRQVGVADAGAEDTVTRSSNSDLYRGLMSSRVVAGQTNQQFRVKFLYNPSTISESRSIDVNSGVIPQYARNPDDPSQFITGLNTTVSFSLLFDRTYELWDSSYVGTLEGKYGVLVDVNAFYNMLNINQQQTISPTGYIGDFTNNQQYSGVVQGAMSPVPVDLYFGYRSTGALRYFGYVTQLDVTYTHFTQKMIPQRCAINVGFTVLPVNYNYSRTQQ